VMSSGILSAVNLVASDCPCVSGGGAEHGSQRAQAGV